MVAVHIVTDNITHYMLQKVSFNDDIVHCLYSYG